MEQEYMDHENEKLTIRENRIETYNSLEEILQDIRRASTMAVIWKLEKTIKSGKYLQNDGKE